MSQTILLDELPRKVQGQLQAAWERHESVVIIFNDEAVAAVVPISEYKKHPSGTKEKGIRYKGRGRKQKSLTFARAPAQYSLPADLLSAYHSLLSKKFISGLTPDEELSMERVGKELDEADLRTPLGQAIMQNAEEEHKRWMTTLSEVIAKLRSLRKSL
jgi:hypothetical protein